MEIFKKILFLLSLIFIFSGCFNNKNQNELVIYTSVDQVFSSKIIKDFKKESGIDVKVLYDTEATKAVSLEKRLIAEQKNPKADIFWNSEFMRTARLDNIGLFTFAKITNKLDYPKSYFYSDKGTWHGIGLRSRVFIVNTNLMNKDDYPSSLEDLLNPKYKGKIAMSLPYSGSTSTHFAALYKKLGEAKFKNFIKQLKNNDIALLGGNSVVKDAVGRGDYLFGLVDSDDALVGIEAGLPVEMLFYNQNSEGTFSVYGTVAKIKGAPNSKNADIFINYLLTDTIENKLIDMKAVQYSILENKHLEFTSWSDTPSNVLDALEPSMKIMRDVLVKRTAKMSR